MDELLKSTIEDREESWATLVWHACRGKCSNCGSEDKVKAIMIVPESAGGKKQVSNGALLCRTCELAKDIANRYSTPASGEHTRPINFFVSRELHRKLTNGLATDYGFRSVSALVRFLMTKFVTDPDRFEDVGMWQDGRKPDVKVNVWVSRDVYASFKAMADSRNMTVTDTLKGLIRMYEAEASRIVGRKD